MVYINKHNGTKTCCESESNTGAVCVYNGTDTCINCAVYAGEIGKQKLFKVI